MRRWYDSFRSRHLFKRFMTWLGSHELSTLVVLIAIPTGMWAFVELADEVFEGDTEQLDRAILLAMRSPDAVDDPLGPRWVEELARDTTALGGSGVLAFITVAAAGYLVLRNKTRATLFLLAAVLGGFAVSTGLKLLFDRARPDLVPHGSHVYTASFPSGHAMMSAVTYLTLGALLARVHPQRRIKAYLLLLTIFLTIAVGVSRVYLGVHWPTDVLAGWAVGACWALLCWVIALYLQRQGQLEGSGTLPE